MRATLATLVTILADAAMDAVVACSAAFRRRWEEISGQKVALIVGTQTVDVPALAFEADAAPYPQKLVFETEIDLETGGDAHIAGHGVSSQKASHRVKVKVEFEFGALPEGAALTREAVNRILGADLDKIS